MLTHQEIPERFHQILNTFTEIADQLERDKDKVISVLNKTETMQMARLEVTKTIRALRTYSKEIPHLLDRKPLGKAGIFLPFNTPLYSLVLYSCGPLLAGNQVIVKPSRQSSEIVNTLFDDYFWGRGLNIELRQPNKQFLSDCITVDKVDVLCFTGQWDSVDAVKREIPLDIKFIYSGSGLNPFVVLADADLEVAARVAVSSRLWNSGQDCLSAERFYIEDVVFDDFVELVLGIVDKQVVDVWQNPLATVGPLCFKALVQNVEHLLHKHKEDYVILRHGSINKELDLVEPIVLEALNPQSPVVLSEKFAPLFPLVRTSKGKISDLVNGADFALGASVYGDEDKTIISSLNFPHIAHNASILEIEDEDAHVPFGGIKNSGFIQFRGNFSQGPILYSVETCTST